jgi:predicted negative regulator of RcsB-dependent stress response
MNPPLLSRRVPRVPIVSAVSLVLVGALTLFAFGAPPPAEGAAALRLARLSEETLPSAEMPPTATPTPAAPSAAQSGGVPLASPTPSPSTEAGPGQTVPETTVAPAEVEPGAEGASSAAAEPTPAAADAVSDVAPLDIGAVKPQLQVSDQPLAAAVREASSPSMAASLRIVDRARKNILAGRPNDAIEMLAHALSVDSAGGYAYFYLGRAWLAKRNYTQAMTFLKRAEISFGSNPEWLGETLAFEGLAYEESGDTTAARAAYQMAMDAEPGNLMARVGYTRLSAQSAPPPAAPMPAGMPGASELAPPPEEVPAPAPPASEPPAPVN